MYRFIYVCTYNSRIIHVNTYIRKIWKKNLPNINIGYFREMCLEIE